MQVVGFIGGYDKSNLIIYIAKIFYNTKKSTNNRHNIFAKNEIYNSNNGSI